MIELIEENYKGYALGNYSNDEGVRTLLGEVIYRNAYRKHSSLSEHLGKLASEVIANHEELKNVDLLTYVPNNREGDKNMEAIINWVADKNNIQRTHDLLCRNGIISEYSEARVFRGGIQVLNEKLVKDKTVLIVDAIMCNGLGLELAAKALKDAGCKEVKALVFSKMNPRVLDAL